MHSHMDAANRHLTRLSEHLRTTLRGAGWTQQAVERRLGWGQGYLSHLLRGRFHLKLRHVFEVLEVIGRDPGRFFLDLYGREEAAHGGHAEVEERLSPELRQEILEEVERQVARLLEGQEKRRGDGRKKGGRKPRKKPASGLAKGR